MMRQAIQTHNKRCLFCKADSGASRNREHIIPESLGNTARSFLEASCATFATTISLERSKRPSSKVRPSSAFGITSVFEINGD